MGAHQATQQGRHGTHPGHAHSLYALPETRCDCQTAKPRGVTNQASHDQRQPVSGMSRGNRGADNLGKKQAQVNHPNRDNRTRQTHNRVRRRRLLDANHHHVNARSACIADRSATQLSAALARLSPQRETADVRPRNPSPMRCGLFGSASAALGDLDHIETMVGAVAFAAPGGGPGPTHAGQSPRETPRRLAREVLPACA